MGGEAQELALPTTMTIVAIDSNAVGNQGLVNRHKIRLRRLSIALHFIAKNHLKRTNYNLFYPRKDLFLYKDEATSRQYVCGLIFLKLMMGVMKPHLVVDHREKEKELEKLTLASCDNDVRVLLTSMQEKRTEIDTLRKDGVTFDEQRFLTLIFDNLILANCTDFKADIKSEKRKWMKNSASVDSTTLIAESVNLYTNYKSNGDWDAEVIDRDKVILALATDLKNARAQPPAKVTFDKKTKGGAKPNGNKLPDWRITKKGSTYTHEGVKYDWCPHHGPKNRGNNKTSCCMYMPHPHDHEEWKAAKARKTAARDKFRAEKQDEKRTSGTKRKPTEKTMKLSKSFHTALTSRVQLSDAEAKDIVESVLNDDEELDYGTDSSDGGSKD